MLLSTESDTGLAWRLARLLQESSGQRVVFASGLIGPGDAQLLAAALKAATRDRHRTKELLLEPAIWLCMGGFCTIPGPVGPGKCRMGRKAA